MFNQFLSQLEKLKIVDKPLWGKMTAQHMVEHLILSMQMSNGRFNFECFNPPEKIPALKRFLLSSRPLPKLFQNPALEKEPSPLKYESLNKAIEKLRTEIDYHHFFFEENPHAKPTNVTFGDLNKDEWEIFHRKHFEHHLSQFGLIEST